MKKRLCITKISVTILAITLLSNSSIAQPTTYGAGAGTSGGATNTYLGGFSGPLNTADGNTFTGYHSGLSSTTGVGNTFTGFNAGSSNTTGQYNTYMGISAGSSSTTASDNVYIGRSSGTYTTGSGNTYIGSNSGNTSSSGSNNTLLGYLTSCTNNPTNATAIGYGAAATTSNTLILGNESVNVGIGLSAPNKKLTLSTAVSNDGIRVIQRSYGYAGLELDNQTAGGNYWGLLSLGNGNIQGSGNFLIYNFSTIGSALLINGSTGNVGIGTTVPGTYKLNVNGSVYAASGYFSSDKRFKNDIAPVENAIELVKSLKGVKYTFKDNVEIPNANDEDKKIMRNFPKGTQIGLIAQDVEKILPEVVATDKDGYKAIAYQNIVPVLIEGIKEQQHIIESQNERIEALESRLRKLEASTTDISTTNNVLDGAELFQNVPNPFRGYTSIGYRLPENTSDAKILIFDMNGRKIKQVQLEGTGEGKVDINATELSAGMYLYSLMINGAEAATKRMILE